jgi:hypothetical protein
MKARLYMDVEFDGHKTNAESIASALDNVVSNGLAVLLDSWEPYGGEPKVGKFLVLDAAQAAGQAHAETCAVCCKTVMPDKVEDAIEQGWLPSYFEKGADAESMGPVCPTCDEQFMVEGEGGETEINLKGEFFSEWGSGHKFRSPCTVNPVTRIATIEQHYEVDNSAGDLLCEYVMLNGKRYEACHSRLRSDYFPKDRTDMFFWE